MKPFTAFVAYSLREKNASRKRLGRRLTGGRASEGELPVVLYRSRAAALAALAARGDSHWDEEVCKVRVFVTELE